MRTIVLGGAGFIGRHLCSRIARLGEDVVGLDVQRADKADFDSRVFDAARDSFDFTDTDAVVYLSQSPHYRDFAEGGDDLFEVNVTGAIRAAIAARKAGARTFVYASTGSVYAPSFEPLSEASPTRRNDAYALSKLTAEDALGLLDGSMSTLAIRLFGVFGPGQQTMLVPAIRGRIERGDPVTLEQNPQDPADDGGLRISLTYVDDVVACILALRDRALAGDTLPAVLNVAAPESVSLRRLANALANHLDTEPRFESLERARASDLVADVTQLQQLIAPRFTEFETAISNTVGTR